MSDLREAARALLDELDRTFKDGARGILFEREFRALTAALNAPQGGGEAVAWLIEDREVPGWRHATSNSTEANGWAEAGSIVTPLYAHPQPAAERAVVEARVPLDTLETWLARLNREEFSGIGHIRAAMEDAIAAAKPAQEPPRAKPAEGGEGGA